MESPDERREQEFLNASLYGGAGLGFHVPYWFPAAPPPYRDFLFPAMINVDDRILSDLNECEMYLVLHIAKYMKSNRLTAWPSIPTLSKVCKWDERTVKKWRKSLIERGFLGMKTTSGKPTVYTFLKDGIGIYTPMKDAEIQEENEVAENGGGTKNEGAFFAERGVQKMRGGGVQKMYPEVIKEIKYEPEEEKAASLFSSSSKEKPFPVEAEKKGVEAELPAPPAVEVEIRDPELPGTKIYDHIPAKNYPTQEPHGEWKRVNIADEIERLKTDAAVRETFAIGRKIPPAHFDEYVEAFRVDITGRGEKYANDRQFRSHFFNWCGVRWERAQRAAKTQTPNGQLAKIRQL